MIVFISIPNFRRINISICTITLFLLLAMHSSENKWMVFIPANIQVFQKLEKLISNFIYSPFSLVFSPNRKRWDFSPSCQQLRSLKVDLTRVESLLNGDFGRGWVYCKSKTHLEFTDLFSSKVCMMLFHQFCALFSQSWEIGIEGVFLEAFFILSVRREQCVHMCDTGDLKPRLNPSLNICRNMSGQVVSTLPLATEHLCIYKVY